MFKNTRPTIRIALHMETLCCVAHIEDRQRHRRLERLRSVEFAFLAPSVSGQKLAALFRGLVRQATMVAFALLSLTLDTLLRVLEQIAA